jgi:hypothetical protein
VEPLISLDSDDYTSGDYISDDSISDGCVGGDSGRWIPSIAASEVSDELSPDAAVRLRYIHDDQIGDG